MVRVGSKETSGGRDKGELGFGDQSENEIVEGGHIMSGGMIFEAGLVFVQSDIARVMQTIFDLPVGAEHVESLGRGGWVSR